MSLGIPAPERPGCAFDFLTQILQLEVEDHGVGICRNDPRRRGIGLVAMRERAELLGGTIEFLNRRGRNAGAIENPKGETRSHASKISVLLVDDHSLVRRGFRRILEDEPDIVVVGEASDGAEAVKLAAQLRPRVIVMDCALPGMNGLEATRRILNKFPETAILMLSMHSEETWVHQALDAGARGYILKNAMDLELVAAIRRVAEGEEVLDPQISLATMLEGRAQRGTHSARTGSSAIDRRRQIEQRNCRRPGAQREHRRRASRQYHGCTRNPQDRRTRCLCDPQLAW